MRIEEGQNSKDENPEADFDPLNGLQLFQFFHILLLEPFLRSMDHDVCKSNLGVGMALLTDLEGFLPFLQGETDVGSVAIRAVRRGLVFQMHGCLSMVVLEIRSFLYGVTDPAHLGHPFSEFEPGLAGDDIMRHMTVPARGSVLLPLQQGLGMGPLEITLILLRVTSLTPFIIVEKCRDSSKEFRIRMSSSFLFNIGMTF
jgi:hypothetical protein